MNLNHDHLLMNMMPIQPLAIYISATSQDGESGIDVYKGRHTPTFPSVPKARKFPQRDIDVGI